jgi:hypothetical protein
MLHTIFLRTYDAVGELAATASTALDARVTHEPDFSEVRVVASALVPGAVGDFRAIMVRPDPQWSFYLPGEFKATDAYDVEFRIRESDVDQPEVDRAMAGLVFARLTTEIDVPALHVYHLEWLVAAYQPGLGPHDFPKGVSVYPEDAGRWGDWVLTSPATRRHQDTGGTLAEARDMLREDLFAVARDVYPDGEPVVEFSQGPLPFETDAVQWVFRVATGAAAPPWDARQALNKVEDALDARGWWVTTSPHLIDGRWTVEATREGHRVTAAMAPEDGILRLSAETPWYPPPDDR